MNRWQVARQLAHKLRTVDWPGGSSDVFAGVAIMAIPDDQFVRDVIAGPVATVTPLDARMDPEYGDEPGIVECDFAIRTFQVVAGDPYGESALIGAHRASATDSDGRGILEIEEVVFDAIGDLGRDLGLVVNAWQARIGSFPITEDREGTTYLAAMEHRVTALCTVDRRYPSPEELVATDAAGAGDVDLSWAAFEDRYDRHRFRLFRASGASAPAYEGGTEVTLASNTATSVTDSPGAGTFSYALYKTYDETGTYDGGTASSDERVSAALTRTSVAVT